jgi:RNA polymerase sigma factor (sigma-70 family)
MVTQLGGTPEDAKDIFQEGLMIMLEKIDNKEFALTCKFKTFLYCVCENLWKSIIAKRQAAVNYFARRTEPEEEKDFTEAMDNNLCREIFLSVFDKLDTVSKNILKLYWEEVSPQEIADRLGYSYGYVRKKKCEAQAELTEKVKMHPDYKKIVNTESVERRAVC